MRKAQNGFTLVEGLLILCFLAVIGFAGWHVYSTRANTKSTLTSSSTHNTPSNDLQVGSGPNYAALSSCNAQTPLNTVPINVNEYANILPLGNFNVPDHALPTAHLYFNFKNHNFTSPLRSPGRIVVTNIENSGETVNGKSLSNDYALTFFACKGVSFIFGHVQTLSGSLATAISGQHWDRPCQNNTPTPSEKTFYCNKSTDIVLQSGEVIGSLGGKAAVGAFDFSANKSGYRNHGFINAKWYSPSFLNSVCPLDYFDSASSIQLYSLIQRTIEPKCGQVGQDKAGTAQGSWYATQDSRQSMNNWSTQLTLAHNNVDPTYGEMAVAGTISTPMTLLFKPLNTGTINREPSSISADGNIYCFQNQAAAVANPSPGSGKVLLQLINNLTLKIEHQNGSCIAKEVFASPQTYYR